MRRIQNGIIRIICVAIIVAALLVTGCRTSPAAAPTDEPAGMLPVNRASSAAETPGTTAAAPSPTAVPVAKDSGGDADVLFVRATQAGGSWTFAVTVEHLDTGWDDYADGWDVVTPDGTVLKADPDAPFTRLLLHPHETEQPFTRSQSGIMIPEGVTEVTVRAHDIVDGFGGAEVVVDLMQDDGDGFQVIRP